VGGGVGGGVGVGGGWRFRERGEGMRALVLPLRFSSTLGMRALVLRERGEGSLVLP
jgi:hypothetical protein